MQLKLVKRQNIGNIAVPSLLISGNEAVLVKQAEQELLQLFCSSSNLDPYIQPKPINQVPDSGSFRRCINISPVAKLIQGEKYATLRWLEREFPGVRARVSYLPASVVNLIVTSLDEYLLQCFVQRIQEIINDSGEAFRKELSEKKASNIHVFVDVSNIAKGCQSPTQTGARNQNRRLNIRHTVELVTGMRTRCKLVVVGSSSPDENNGSFWDQWKKETDHVYVIPRSQTSGGRFVEAAVDDVIHAQIASDISNTYRYGTVIEQTKKIA